MIVKNCLECGASFVVRTNQKYCCGCNSFNYKLKQRRQRAAKLAKGLCEACGKPRGKRPYRCENCNLIHQIQGWRAIGIVGADKTFYDALLARQKGVCAICHTVSKSRKLSLDHNHGTKAPRGLLCDGCNAGVGAVERLLRHIGGWSKLIEYVRSDTRDVLLEQQLTATLER